MDANIKNNQIRLTSLRGNYMRLDGGSMFGNAPN